MAMTEPAAPPPTDEDETGPETGLDPSEETTVRICSEPGCQNSFVKLPGMGRRSKCDAHYQGTGRRAGRPRKIDGSPDGVTEKEWTLEEAINTPLSRTEKELADRIEILVTLVGGMVYRMNITDGLIVSYHSEGVARGLVIEARTSKQVKKMVQAMAQFSGAGPLAITLVNMSMQMAANHHVPVIGDLAQVPEKVRIDAARIMATREQAQKAQRVASDAVIPPRPVGFAECPKCHRRSAGMPGAQVTCFVCNIPFMVPA